jgi:hypothetical protein
MDNFEAARLLTELGIEASPDDPASPAEIVARLGLVPTEKSVELVTSPETQTALVRHLHKDELIDIGQLAIGLLKDGNSLEQTARLLLRRPEESAPYI